MKRVYIPIHLLRNRINQKGYKPILFDGRSTEFIEYKYIRRESYKGFWLQLLLGLITISFIYYIIINPILETSLTRSQISEILAESSQEDKIIFSNIKSNYKVLEEQVDSNIIYSIVVSVDSDHMTEVLQQISKLSRLQEVYVDDNKVGFSVLLSEQ